MCLSQTVSFTASAFLVVGGGHAVTRAWAINPRYLPVALMPVFAGLQQFMEGNVWWGVNTGDPGATLLGALGFIFFTWFMWPFWIPLASWVLEPPGSRRRPWMAAMSVAGLAFGLALYVPHLVNPGWIGVTVNQDSLAYEGTMLLDYLMPRWMTYAIYLFLIIVPPAISSYLHMRWFALTIVAVVVVDIL
ncbi:MAG: DUF6629 family protein, partial [Paracoccus sp. (in: a-proteobacteria)]